MLTSSQPSEAVRNCIYTGGYINARAPLSVYSSLSSILTCSPSPFLSRAPVLVCAGGLYCSYLVYTKWPEVICNCDCIWSIMPLSGIDWGRLVLLPPCLQDEELARQLVELGYRGTGEVPEWLASYSVSPHYFFNQKLSVVYDSLFPPFLFLSDSGAKTWGVWKQKAGCSC